MAVLLTALRAAACTLGQGAKQSLPKLRARAEAAAEWDTGVLGSGDAISASGG
jgi:hypothetical protein